MQNMIEPDEDIEECPHCGSEKVVLDTKKGEMVCSSCGRILQRKLKDRGKEWRAYDPMEKASKKRTGPPVNDLIADRGMSTFISKTRKDGKGKYLDPDSQQRVYKLRKWQRRMRHTGTIERSIAFAITEIGTMCSRLALPKVVAESAANLYREASKKDLIRGRSKEAVVAGSLYASCRILEVPRTMREISKASVISSKEMRRAYRVLVDALDLEVPLMNPERFVERYGRELDLNSDVIKDARDLVTRAREKHLTIGRNPRGVVGACLYIAARLDGIDMSQSQVGEEVGVTEVTIRNRYKEIVEEMGIESNNL